MSAGFPRQHVPARSVAWCLWGLLIAGGFPQSSVWMTVAHSQEPDTVQPRPSPADVQRLFGKQVFQGESGATLPYRLLAPPPTSDSDVDRRYPLVLFLHGAGERGQDNERQLVHAAAEFARPERRQAYPAYVVFPQCPKETKWVLSPWEKQDGTGTFPEQPSEPLALALELVTSLQRTLPIDDDRVYVTGLSMGGYGSWYAAGHSPDRFAAMLAVCGGGDPEWAGRYQGVSVWAFHGDADPTVPVQRSRQMISALALAGHQPELRYVEYPGVGHDSWTRTYARQDVFAWLFSKRRSQ
ncbi:prolyl oligopeptidase family serine peptidase [Roseiconus nitratireducens]|uniref:Prolyl oligopeptidase family serine peptidase n=1 Tax=Roseiconus nitratireducens TaxID=2605748 RepID=A0A5M6D392_9BACT|nr:alpha/beta hydrolase-fold protein [Roseiconus nitratireducens]KAA5541070.1 prolyl oligopeptidase family serine peptidase [Roseiconus nitratireducens]